MFNNNIDWKKKIKIVVAIIGISISLGYILVNFEIEGWNQAVNLTTYLFNKPVEDVSVTYPHAQDTYQNLIKWYFGTQAQTALAVASAENGTHTCNRIHQNTNGTIDIGIFQINSIHAAKGNLYDCRDNVRVAYEIFKASGFSAWVTYKNGAYKKFLNT